MLTFTSFAHRNYALVAASILAAQLLLGCKSTAPSASTQATNTPAVQKPSFPPRPAVPPPRFKIFHYSQSSFTLTVKPAATDEEVEALIWQLRDASRARTLDQIKISQKAFDTDGSTVWFHIYRGTKCAPEKYAPGPLPCGGGYHASGDYTYSTVNHQPWDSGTLLHDEDHRVRLWDPEASTK